MGRLLALLVIGAGPDGKSVQISNWPGKSRRTDCIAYRTNAKRDDYVFANDGK